MSLSVPTFRPHVPKRRREHGSATLETVIVWPAVFLLIFGIVHTGIWFHARNIALTAAQEGARTASLHNGAGGAARAAEFISSAGSESILTVRNITQSARADDVTVTVSAASTTMIPGWTIDVTQSSTAPIRRWADP